METKIELLVIATNSDLPWKGRETLRPALLANSGPQRLVGPVVSLWRSDVFFFFFSIFNPLVVTREHQSR